MNKVVTYHRTTRQAAQAILEHGVDIAQSRVGAYGQGFYTASDVSLFAGDADLAVAVRLRRPLAGGTQDIEWQLDAIVDRLTDGRGHLTAAVAAGLRRELLDLGYDGLIVRDAGGDGVDDVIALHEYLVKVVQP